MIGGPEVKGPFPTKANPWLEYHWKMDAITLRDLLIPLTLALPERFCCESREAVSDNSNMYYKNMSCHKKDQQVKGEYQVLLQLCKLYLGPNNLAMLYYSSFIYFPFNQFSCPTPTSIPQQWEPCHL